MYRSVKEIAKKYSRKYKPTLFDDGVGARLPNEYRKFYDEWRNTQPEPVHYIPEIGTWKRDERTNEIKRIENIPLPEIHANEINKIFSGGEKIILGFTKKKKYSTRVPHFWVPLCFKSAVYSEILDKFLGVIMTKRVVDLIHKNQGFDEYLLKTKACDLGTLVAIKLKKKLLLSLANKDLPYSEEKNQIIFDKYKQYLIPLEELEWYGLTFGEACRKQIEIEKAKEQESLLPLKYIYRQKLIADLKTEIN